MRHSYGFIATTRDDIIQVVHTHVRFKSKRVRNMCQAKAKTIPNLFVGAVYAKTVLQHNDLRDLEDIDSVEEFMAYVDNKIGIYSETLAGSGG